MFIYKYYVRYMIYCIIGLQKCAFNVGVSRVIAGFLLLLTTGLVIKEFFQFSITKFSYIKDPANYLQWMLFGLSVVTIIPAFQPDFQIASWLAAVSYQFINHLLLYSPTMQTINYYCFFICFLILDMKH